MRCNLNPIWVEKNEAMGFIGEVQFDKNSCICIPIYIYTYDGLHDIL